MARPDLVLLDLIHAQFPDFHPGDHTFLRALAQPTSSTNYQCNLKNWTKANYVLYQNATSDRPVIPTSSKLPLAATIGLSVLCGLVGLSCIATAVVLFIRKVKNGWGRNKFNKLEEETMMEEVVIEEHHLLHEKEKIII
jgi:hypothetical protein